MPHGSFSGDSLGLSADSATVQSVPNDRSETRPCCRGCDLLANFAARVVSLFSAMLFVVTRAVKFFRPSPGAASVACAGPVVTEALESRQLLSATYFVSPAGSDSNPGTINAPFRTIQRAAGVASPGSTVDIRAGVYRETVTPASSGVTFEAYNNENVTVDGANVLSGWSRYSGNVYQTRAAGDLGFGNNQIYVNGQAMTEASYPNVGLNLSRPTLATVQSGGYGLTSSAVGASGVNWVGGVVHIVSGQGWVSQTATITGQSGNHIYFGLAGTVDPHGGVTAGNRFYLTGKLSALRSPGQFFVGNGNSYLITPNGSNPAGSFVEQKARQWGFNLSGKSNVTIRNINLFACSIVANGTSGIHLDHINARYVSQFIVNSNGWNPPVNAGIILNGHNNSITNSTIAYSAGHGVLLMGSGNVARNNVIHDVDYAATDAAGIYTWGSGDTIDHNTIYNAGRDGIHFSGTTNTQVTGNLVHDVTLQTSDGGGIYTYGANGAGSTIAYNRVYNVHSFGWGAAGLYLDNGSHNFSVHNNDVFNVDIGLKMNPTNFNEYVANNTLIAGMQSVASYGNRNMSGSQFIHNVFNNALMIGGSVRMVANVSGGDTSGVGFAGANIG